MKRDSGLDLAKIIAMFLVAWGHLVGVSSYETSSIMGIIEKNSSLPLLPVDEHSLWMVESFFYNMLNVQFAVVGVIIFFIISGMFIPYMQEKYSNKSCSKFFIFTHCYKRIFPTLLIATLFVAFIEKYLQGINFSLTQILATATCTTSLFQLPPVIGVIWFLIVLEVMWFICAFFPKFTVQNIFSLYLICLFLIVFPHISETMYRNGLMVVAYNARMIGIILLGVLWSITKNIHLVDKILYFFFATIICLVTLNAYENFYSFPETYDNIFSYLVAFCIILVAKFIDTAINKLPYNRFKSYYIKGIKYISGLFLPFYLSHVCVGLNTIWCLKKTDLSPSVIVLLSFISSFLVAVLINKIVLGLISLKNKLHGGVKCS